MTIQQSEVPMHWHYFLSLEEDLHALARSIEFCQANFGCYSIDLARILMAAASEVDVAAKLLCADVDVSSKSASINAYQSTLVRRFPGLPTARVIAPRFGLVLEPWINWKTADTPPDWWQSNNKVKHHRSEHFNQATVSNALNATAGLFVLLAIYYGHRLEFLFPAPHFFKPVDYGVIENDRLIYIGTME